MSLNLPVFQHLPLNRDKLNFGDEGLIRPDDHGAFAVASAPAAIGKVGGYVEDPFGSLLHEQQSLLISPWIEFEQDLDVGE